MLTSFSGYGIGICSKKQLCSLPAFESNIFDFQKKVQTGVENRLINNKGKTCALVRLFWKQICEKYIHNGNIHVEKPIFIQDSLLDDKLFSTLLVKNFLHKDNVIPARFVHSVNEMAEFKAELFFQIYLESPANTQKQ